MGIYAPPIYRANLMGEVNIYGNQLFSSVNPVLSDVTTDMTTSHLTNPAQDAGQVIGYSHSTKLAKGFA